MAGAAAVFAGEGGCSVVLYGFDDALCKTGDALDLGGDDDLGGLAVGGGGESLQRAQTQHVGDEIKGLRESLSTWQNGVSQQIGNMEGRIAAMERKPK